MKPNYYWPLALPLLVACNPPAQQAQLPRPALVVTVGEETAAAPTVLIGEIRSRYESSLGFRIAGKIVQRLAEVGSAVKQGQTLARLDATDTGLSAQAAQAEVGASEADLALAKSELERQRQLNARKFISAAALDVHEARFKSAKARLQQTQAQAAMAVNQSRYASLIADRSGVVTEIRAEPGQVVEAGEPIARIAVTEAPEVVIAVPESRMEGVIVGKEAEIRLWTNRDKVYRGKVREVAPAADSATRTFQVRVAFEAPEAALRLGTTAGVRFYHEARSGWLLPSAAVAQDKGRTVVWVVDSKTHRVQPTPVVTGPYREDGVVITQGLNGGEQVVAAGVHALAAGIQVNPVALVNHR